MRPAYDGAVAAKLQFVENGRLTRRFHGLPVHNAQRVDSHLYGQSVLIKLLIGDEAPAERRLRLLEAALFDGDISEWITGDIPAPTKRRMPDYPEGTFRAAMADYEDEVMEEAGFDRSGALDAQDRRVLKLADAVEGCLHSINERYMGNAHPRNLFCFYEFWKYAVEEQGLDSAVWRTEHNMPEEPGEAGLRFYIRTEWTRANGGTW